MTVHFTDSESFFEVCFASQQTKDFDSYAAVNWRFDAQNQLAQITLVNPLMESQSDVTLAVANKDELLAIQANYSKRFTTQFNQRIGTFQKPVYQVVAEYSSWQDLRDIWLVRDSKNVARLSVPLLFDLQQTSNTDTYTVFATFYISSSREFYRFNLHNLPEQQITDMKRELIDIVLEAYV